jgi:hypothetical protein
MSFVLGSSTYDLYSHLVSSLGIYSQIKQKFLLDIAVAVAQPVISMVQASSTIDV